MAEHSYTDILYEERDHVATVTFNRPDRLNAFTAHTYVEVADAVLRAGWNRDIGVIVLTGAGDRAFGVGGDKDEKKSDRVDRNRGILGNGVEELQTCPSPSLPRCAAMPLAAATCW